MTLLYIKVEANIVADYFSRIPMVHHTHKLTYNTLEEDTCELLCLDLLFIYDNTNYLSPDKEGISLSLAPQTMEEEHNLELQSESSTNIRTDINKTNYDWKYKSVKVTNLVYYHDRVYVPKPLRKCVLKWYNCSIQYTGSDRLTQKLTTVCRW